MTATINVIRRPERSKPSRFPLAQPSPPDLAVVVQKHNHLKLPSNQAENQEKKS
jgi:hypothetical protein